MPLAQPSLLGPEQGRDRGPLRRGQALTPPSRAEAWLAPWTWTCHASPPLTAGVRVCEVGSAGGSPAPLPEPPLCLLWKKPHGRWQVKLQKSRQFRGPPEPCAFWVWGHASPGGREPRTGVRRGLRRALKTRKCKLAAGVSTGMRLKTCEQRLSYLGKSSFSSYKELNERDGRSDAQ